MIIINCNGDRRRAGTRRLGPRHPPSNYRLMTVPHRHDLPGSRTHLFFFVLLPTSCHTQGMLANKSKGDQSGAGQWRLRPRHPLPNCLSRTSLHRHDPPGQLTSPFSHSPFRLSLRKEEGAGEVEAMEQFTL